MIQGFPVVPFAFAVGLCLGSFLNVCIYRMPRGGSLWRPGSRCPGCRRAIAAYDNIPVLSYLWLRGRCRRCGARISRRYPLVELLMGAITAGLAATWAGLWLWLAVTVAAAGALVALSFIDFDTFFIPDALSLGLVLLGLAASSFNPWFEGPWLARLGVSAGGAAAGFAVAFAMALAGEWIFKKEALGMGDVKLMAGVGALLGWEATLSTLMLGSVAGSAYGLALMWRGRIGRRDAIPFGPFLSLGALVNLFHRLSPVDLFLY